MASNKAAACPMTEAGNSAPTTPRWAPQSTPFLDPCGEEWGKEEEEKEEEEGSEGSTQLMKSESTSKDRGAVMPSTTTGECGESDGEGEDGVRTGARGWCGGRLPPLNLPKIRVGVDLMLPEGGSPRLLLSSPGAEGSFPAEGEEASPRGSNVRPRFSQEQCEALERSFQENRNLDANRRAALASALGVQPRQVAIWFQNRCARLRYKLAGQQVQSMSSKYSEILERCTRLEQRYECLKQDHHRVLEQNANLRCQISELTAALSKLAEGCEPGSSKRGSKRARSSSTTTIAMAAAAATCASAARANPRGAEGPSGVRREKGGSSSSSQAKTSGGDNKCPPQSCAEASASGAAALSLSNQQQQQGEYLQGPMTPAKGGASFKDYYPPAPALVHAALEAAATGGQPSIRSCSKVATAEDKEAGGGGAESEEGSVGAQVTGMESESEAILPASAPNGPPTAAGVGTALAQAAPPPASAPSFLLHAPATLSCTPHSSPARGISRSSSNSRHTPQNSPRTPSSASLRRPKGSAPSLVAATAASPSPAFHAGAQSPPTILKSPSAAEASSAAPPPLRPLLLKDTSTCSLDAPSPSCSGFAFRSPDTSPASTTTLMLRLPPLHLPPSASSARPPTSSPLPLSAVRTTSLEPKGAASPSPPEIEAKARYVAPSTPLNTTLQPRLLLPTCASRSPSSAIAPLHQAQGPSMLNTSSNGNVTGNQGDGTAATVTARRCLLSYSPESGPQHQVGPRGVGPAPAVDMDLGVGLPHPGDHCGGAAGGMLGLLEPELKLDELLLDWPNQGEVGGAASAPFDSSSPFDSSPFDSSAPFDDSDHFDSSATFDSSAPFDSTGAPVFGSLGCDSQEFSGSVQEGRYMDVVQPPLQHTGACNGTEDSTSTFTTVSQSLAQLQPSPSTCSVQVAPPPPYSLQGDTGLGIHPSSSSWWDMN